MKPVRYMVVLALVVAQSSFGHGAPQGRGRSPGHLEQALPAGRLGRRRCSTCARVRAIRDDHSIANPVGGCRFGEKEVSAR